MRDHNLIHNSNMETSIQLVGRIQGSFDLMKLLNTVHGGGT